MPGSRAPLPALFFIAVPIFWLQAFSADRVEMGQLALELDAAGGPARISIADHSSLNFTASTVLAECTPLGRPHLQPSTDGALTLERSWKSADGRTCRCVDRFTHTDSSLRWELSIIGDSNAPWSVPIETRLSLKRAAGLTFWSAWDDPLSRDGWHDPLVPIPFGNHLLWYGQPSYEADPYAGYPERYWNHFSIPMVAVLDASADAGWTLALSPEDRLLDLSLSTTPQGRIVFSRQHHRIRKGRTLSFAMDLYTHAADWRPALAWMVERYPGYFHPPNPAVADMAGTGTYSRHEGELDAVKLYRMAFRVNWKASFDFAYLGMYLPPDRRVKQWTDFYG